MSKAPVKKPSTAPSMAPSAAQSKAPNHAPQSSSKASPSSSSSRAPSSSQAPSSSRAPTSQSSAPSRQPVGTHLVRDKVQSQAPQSQRPSSQAPGSGAGSISPQSSSRASSAYAPSRAPVESQVPGSRAPGQSMAPGSRLPSSIAFGSRIPGSMAPGSRVPGQNMAPGSSRAPSSRFPGRMSGPPGTQLIRDEVVSLGSRVPIKADDESMEFAKQMSSVRPGSRNARQTLDRIISRAPSAIATKLDRDNVPVETMSFTPSKTASRVPIQMAPSAPPQIPSILSGDHDREMAASQLQRDTMPCKQQQEQDEWAIDKLTATTGKACPDNREVSDAPNPHLDPSAQLLTRPVVPHRRRLPLRRLWPWSDGRTYKRGPWRLVCGRQGATSGGRGRAK